MKIRGAPSMKTPAGSEGPHAIVCLVFPPEDLLSSSGLYFEDLRF